MHGLQKIIGGFAEIKLARIGLVAAARQERKSRHRCNLNRGVARAIAGEDIAQALFVRQSKDAVQLAPAQVEADLLNETSRLDRRSKRAIAWLRQLTWNFGAIRSKVC